MSGTLYGHFDSEKGPYRNEQGRGIVAAVAKLPIVPPSSRAIMGPRRNGTENQRAEPEREVAEKVRQEWYTRATIAYLR